MARPINLVAAQAELKIIETTIATLQTMDPLPGCQIKTVKPARTAGKPWQMRGICKIYLSRCLQPIDCLSRCTRVSKAY